jgi:hypothetical protein
MKNDKPLVSICISTYNGQDSTIKTISSKQVSGINFVATERIIIQINKIQ